MLFRLILAKKTTMMTIYKRILQGVIILAVLIITSACTPNPTSESIVAHVTPLGGPLLTQVGSMYFYEYDSLGHLTSFRIHENTETNDIIYQVKGNHITVHYNDTAAFGKPRLLRGDVIDSLNADGVCVALNRQSVAIGPRKPFSAVPNTTGRLFYDSIALHMNCHYEGLHLIRIDYTMQRFSDPLDSLKPTRIFQEETVSNLIWEDSCIAEIGIHSNTYRNVDGKEHYGELITNMKYTNTLKNPYCQYSSHILSLLFDEDQNLGFVGLYGDGPKLLPSSAVIDGIYITSDGTKEGYRDTTNVHIPHKTYKNVINGQGLIEQSRSIDYLYNGERL